MVKRSGFPEPSELVICTIEKVSQNAAWCRLDEYGKLEGMIHVSESAGKWVYNIKDVVKVGKQYVAKVMKVSGNGREIDLSLKRVNRFDEKKKFIQYRKEQHAENILSHVAKSLGKNLEETYEEVGFKLQENFGELSTAFEELKEHPELLDKMEIKGAWKDSLKEVIKRIFVEKKTLLKAEVGVKNYGPDGINIIKSCLSDLEKEGFVVKYISAPKYVLEVETTDPKKTEKLMVGKLEFWGKEMREKDGELSYKLLK